MATSNGDEGAVYRAAVRQAVNRARQQGLTSINDILAACEGADPTIVASVLKELDGVVDSQLNNLQALGRARETIDTIPDFPAPDPSRSQWWFSSVGLNRLLNLIEISGAQLADAYILSLGCPTLGTVLSQRKLNTFILDADADVIKAVGQALPDVKTCTAIPYDVSDPLPSELLGKFQIAVLDPPWYKACIYAFMNRALSALSLGGEAFCTLPGRLTRPGTEVLSQQFLKDLMDSGHEILRLERGTIEYQVPRFEFVALRKDFSHFQGVPWRTGDLLQIRKKSQVNLTSAVLPRPDLTVFSRNPTEFRVFTRGTNSAKDSLARVLDKYSSNVSTRAHKDEYPDVWSTEKVGIHTSNNQALQVALESWATQRNDKEATVQYLVEKQYVEIEARHIVEELDRVFELWLHFAAQPPLRTEAELAEVRKKALTEWATAAQSDREHPEKPDLFRPPYQRDRDRVLWSAGLRRLSNKTQLFPADHDDDLRQRLTHSIEVYQLAATIGASFGLDGDLIETGALAHDIGHTPFGHAGEHALNQLFNVVHSPLGGFNHYEHGVDVVRYLEGPYYASSVTQFSGLNLSDEVIECIFKHTFCHTGNFGSEDLWKQSKHNDRIVKGYCHLEGQAVRAADKISYLISDIEDGIRLNCLTNADLLSCRLFHRPQLNFHVSKHQTLREQFLEQRRILLKLLMEDILRATGKRLTRLTSCTPQAVRNAPEYIIQHSSEMLGEMSEVWEKLQVGKLHSDGRVVSANLQAARITAELTIVYSLIPDLMDMRYRQEYERLRSSRYLAEYRKRVGSGGKVKYQHELVSFLPMHLLIGSKNEPGNDIPVAVEDLIMAKDYVAGLSDSRARFFHKDIFKS